MKIHHQKSLSKYWLILLFPLGILLSYTAQFLPHEIERFYSKQAYRAIAQIFSIMTGIIPLSVAELLVILSLITVIILLGRFIYNLWVFRRPSHTLLIGIGNAFIIVSIVYFSFVLIWGLNYHRLPFSDIAGLDAEPASVKELEAVCQNLIARANQIRPSVLENDRGVMRIPASKGDVFKRASLGYVEAANFYSELGGTYGIPKGPIFSRFMSISGISGIYFPFTWEANVNVETPDCMLPATTSHEMAHQRGFAREDEANYIAYLTCTLHPDVDFQYSGILLALIHSMNALYRYNPDQYAVLRKGYDPGIERDLYDLNLFWKQFEGPIERTSSKINNAYLKSNMQEDGIHSYGRMVDLLIAEYRLKNK